MNSLVQTVTMICFITITISILLLLIRAIKGPTNPDRVVALDTIGINLIAMTALLAIRLKTSTYNDIILLIGILTFIGTIAFSKFIEKGVSNDRDHH